MPRGEPVPETIQRLAFAPFAPFALLAGMQLDVFTALGEGPRAADRLAGELGVDSARLELLLYALVVAGLLEHVDGGFANGPEAAHFLVRGSPAYLGPLHDSLALMWHAALQTADSIRASAPRAKIDFATMSTEELSTFLGGLHGEALAAGHALAQSRDYGARRALIDVGGGSGGLSIAMTGAWPRLRATVADLPRVVPVAERFIAEAGAAARVRVVAADVVEAPPPGTYDLAVLRALIQVLGPEEARRAIQNVNRALAPGGEIVVIGRILDDSRLSPEDTVLTNLVFLNVFDAGQAYTEGEHRRWLAEAGFVDIEREVDSNGRGLIRARKPGPESA